MIMYAAGEENWTLFSEEESDSSSFWEKICNVGSLVEMWMVPWPFYVCVNTIILCFHPCSARLCSKMNRLSNILILSGMSVRGVD